MLFPYEQYKTLPESPTVYYPAGEETLARWVFQTVRKATQQLTQLLNLPLPDMEILVVSADDWSLAPHSELEETSAPHPYWSDATTPPTFVVPVEIDPIFGEFTTEKFAFMLYHELALAYLEDDPRPWPAESPLWADEWQFKFAALWLSYTLDGQRGMVNEDLRAQYADIFEPEADGKTPVTVRGFDWYEDTSTEDYLMYELLLEQFAADLLSRYDASILPRFLTLYRHERPLLSDTVVEMLVSVLGPQSDQWLEDLVYF
jgi:hypothetical protein